MVIDGYIISYSVSKIQDILQPRCCIFFSGYYQPAFITTNSKFAMKDVQPFTLRVPDSQLEKLKQKLEDASFPDELDDVGWDLGAPLADVKRVAAYWKDGFDWRKAETKINELPQFTTSIHTDGFDPLKIHFVHRKSKVASAIPLLFCHGCLFPHLIG